MNSHRLDPTALVAGLLFLAIGFGVLADQQYESVDLGVVAGFSIALGGNCPHRRTREPLPH